MITELELINFRGFGQLKLTGLGPVNLIVGMNNVGKTSILEAVSLLGGEGHQGEFHKLYRNVPDNDRRNFGASSYFSFLRKDGIPDQQATEIRARTTDGDFHRLSLNSRNHSPTHPPATDPSFRSMGDLGGLNYTRHGSPDGLTSLAATSLNANQQRRLTLLSKLLESGALEDQLIQMLQSLDERVDAVRILSQDGHSYVAIGFKKKQRIPVSHAGQGLDRVISIFSEILGSKADVICIDEIENGLHYTALGSIWQGIAEIVARLGMQVFITTHSRECLEAAHRVFEQRPTYDLRVVQLYRVRGELEGRVLDREHIEAAMESEIEVRG